MQSHPSLASPARARAAVVLSMLAASQTALGAKGATIRLPENLATGSARIEFEGFGGYNRGNYRGAEFRGAFTRIESRLGVFDPLYVANKAKSSFTIEDADGAALIASECRAVERTATVKVVSIDFDKLTYECSFSGPEASGDTRFVLGEPKREGFKQKLLAQDRRTGEASVLGREFVFESVHEYQGSRLKSQTPLGYLLTSNGVAVAAVDLLDWNPIVHLSDTLSDTERRAATVVALALATLRDPANSTLGD
jgi:hypothetical protein